MHLIISNKADRHHGKNWQFSGTNAPPPSPATYSTATGALLPEEYFTTRVGRRIPSEHGFLLGIRARVADGSLQYKKCSSAEHLGPRELISSRRWLKWRTEENDAHTRGMIPRQQQHTHTVHTHYSEWRLIERTTTTLTYVRTQTGVLRIGWRECARQLAIRVTSSDEETPEVWCWPVTGPERYW